MDEKGQNKGNKSLRNREASGRITDFVLDKSIFSNVFDKDIRRVYIYRKSERLAKAIHLITPAFASAPSLRNRLDSIAVGLIDAAIRTPVLARDSASRELLALSSLLSVARTGGLISDMNADLIIREAHTLLQEVASYEEPRLFMDEVSTLADLSRQAPDLRPQHDQKNINSNRELVPQRRAQIIGHPIGHISDTENSKRREAILEILKAKGPLYIKDISTVIRDVSEKTIQRELQSLVTSGAVQRTGERRWTQYSLASNA